MVHISQLLPGVIAGVAMLAAVPLAAADDPIAGYRKDVYAAVGGHMKSAVAIIKGEVPFQDDLSTHAQALADLARMTLRVFPEGSGEGDTRALAVIWEKPEDFAKAQNDFVTAAAVFAEAAKQGPEAAAPAIGALGKTCKACHDAFRAEK